MNAMMTHEMTHDQTVALLGVIAYGLVGGAFLTLSGFSPSGFLRKVREVHQQFDAVAALRPTAVALLFAILWLLALALWPLLLVAMIVATVVLMVKAAARDMKSGSPARTDQ
ncbi:hypothetical protein ACIOEX_01370 [Streptomyces sp. NPDC087850]|uniref:hypothetical protein n=1 Tax=Streptomyces sp. NPDC087850 TaxID=3365809 RepID=UPI0037FCE8B9